MDYSYEFAMEEDIFGFLIFYLIYMLLAFGLGIASYVLRSLGVYTIAQRRGIKHAWFSWFPIADYYLLGCISDQFQYVVKGKVRNKRKVLLGLSIVMWLIFAAFFAVYISLMVNAVQGAMVGASEDELVRSMMGSVLGLLGLFIPMMALSIAVIVFRYMALYDLYTSCSPRNNVLFLVLSIIFSVTEPFFIFFNRKKDDGMPPRKPEPQYMPAEPVAEMPEPKPETDPWDRPDSE